MVTVIGVNVSGSHFFGDEFFNIMWPGTGRPTTCISDSFRDTGPFFGKFKWVGYRATTCMSLARFLQLSKPWPSCPECMSQFETDRQVQQHINSVHRGQEHQYRKPKTKRERLEIRHLQTTPVVLTIHPIQLDPSQFRLSFLTLSGTRFITSLHMPASDTVSDLNAAIQGRPELALSGGYRRLARLLLQDGRELHEFDQQTLLATVFDNALK